MHLSMHQMSVLMSVRGIISIEHSLLLLQIRYKQPTPAETPLVLRSQVVKMELLSGPGRKATVQVQLTLHKLNAGGKETLLASAQGVYKKLGALRAM